MAKSKHATALFEVIHSSSRFSGPAGRSAMLTPKWWFKGRPKQELSRSDNAPSIPPSLPTETDQPATPVYTQDVAPGAVAERHSAERETFVAEASAQPPLGRSAVQLYFDRDRHEMTLRLRYTTAIVSGFAVMVALGLAYVMGRHIAGGPQTASASPTTEELRKGPAQPSVMDIGKPGDRGLTQTPSQASTDIPRSHEVAPIPAPGTPTGGATDGHRVVHTNYIIVQSYPTQKSAIDARDFLIQAGIPCTAEKAPPGYTADPNWYSVITTTGYQHPRGAEGEAYLRSIENISERFAGNSRFKRFEPHWYSWR